MAFPDDYRPYAGTTADLAVTETDDVLSIAPNATFDVYDAAGEGNQVTDLCDDSGAAITEVVADSGGNIPRFWAPNTLAEVWLDSGGEVRRQAPHADLGSIPLGGGGGGEGTVVSVNGIEPGVGGNVALGIADIPDLAAELEDAASTSYAGLPPGSMVTVDKGGGSWPSRPTSREDIIIRWRGVAPSPTIGFPYAMDGVDDWDEL